METRTSIQAQVTAEDALLRLSLAALNLGKGVRLAFRPLYAYFDEQKPTILLEQKSCNGLSIGDQVTFLYQRIWYITKCANGVEHIRVRESDQSVVFCAEIQQLEWGEKGLVVAAFVKLPGHLRDAKRVAMEDIFCVLASYKGFLSALPSMRQDSINVQELSFAQAILRTVESHDFGQVLLFWAKGLRKIEKTNS